MILIINVCFDRFNELEFVEPVCKIIEAAGISYFIKHYLEIRPNEIKITDGIIICSTSLKDSEYLSNIDTFNYLKHIEKPVLGICAGMQIIAKIFDNELIDKKMIGQYKVKVEKVNSLSFKNVFYSYFLVTKIIKVNSNFNVIATSNDVASVIKKKGKEIYGCLFHPEALNTEIILNFCRIANS